MSFTQKQSVQPRLNITWLLK